MADSRMVNVIVLVDDEPHVVRALRRSIVLPLTSDPKMTAIVEYVDAHGVQSAFSAVRERDRLCRERGEEARFLVICDGHLEGKDLGSDLLEVMKDEFDRQLGCFIFYTDDRKTFGPLADGKQIFFFDKALAHVTVTDLIREKIRSFLK